MDGEVVPSFMRGEKKCEMNFGDVNRALGAVSTIVDELNTVIFSWERSSHVGSRETNVAWHEALEGSLHCAPRPMSSAGLWGERQAPSAEEEEAAALAW